MKKFVILIGSYCSGKTELALNMAANAASAGRRTLVVDLDRINDYFRMSDQIPMLSEKKIELVSPTFVGKGLTQTNMPAAVASAFDSDWDLVIFDVGGDPRGRALARALSRGLRAPRGRLARGLRHSERLPPPPRRRPIRCSASWLSWRTSPARR